MGPGVNRIMSNPINKKKGDKSIRPNNDNILSKTNFIYLSIKLLVLKQIRFHIIYMIDLTF